MSENKINEFKQYVTALNKQFVEWCQQQVTSKPDKFLTTGITDYLRHSGKLRQQFSDVIEQEKESNNNTTGVEKNVYAPLLSLMPLCNTKTIHLIRHGEGWHNVGYLNADAHLTPKGWEQAHALGRHMSSFPITAGVQLVIVSPLMRTLETAAGVFAINGVPNGQSNANSNGKQLKVLMRSQTEERLTREAHEEILASSSLQFIAHELCRERLGPSECDQRRPLSEVKPHFPAIDFSLIESDADTAWTKGNVESEQSVVSRGHKFLQYLMSRPETNIAVVTHSAFLWFTLTTFGNEYAKPVRNNLQKWYENGEMRTIVLSDGSGQLAPGVDSSAQGGVGYFKGGHAFKEPQQALMAEENR